MDSISYDYIIVGAGASGLNLARGLIVSKKLGKKRILVIDREKKLGNDRTWCFWEDTHNWYDGILAKQWDCLSFKAEKYQIEFNIAPYKYKMLRSSDFYRSIFDLINGAPNVDFIEGEVLEVKGKVSSAEVHTKTAIYEASYVFSSLFNANIDIPPSYHYLKQHFLGWYIKVHDGGFNEQVATLMDFRTEQFDGAHFFYVLPIGPHDALVEYTIFSRDVYPISVYESFLIKYINKYLNTYKFDVLSQEYGVIPMTDYPYGKPNNTSRIVPIGLGGHKAKASTGYAFSNILEHTKKIVEKLEKARPPVIKPTIWKERFQVYDSSLLFVLSKKSAQAQHVFTRLFKKNAPKSILVFLSEGSNIKEELSIMSSVPFFPFVKALLCVLWRNILVKLQWQRTL